MYNLGRLYENGYGVARNLDQAGKLYLQAAGRGNAEAKTRLARLNSNRK
jgi:TPR repeat protein